LFFRHFIENQYAMKKYVVLLSAGSLFLLISEKSIGQVNNPGTVVQTNASNQANNNINNSVDNGLNGVTNGLKGMFKKKKKMTHADSVQMMQNQAAQQPANPNSPNSVVQPAGNTGAVQGSTPKLSSYQNYDFVPGNNILFEDEFTDDQSGEFPTHWDLKSGQAVLNMQGTDKAFFLIDGNYCKVQPLMKNEAYLTKNFSIEYDLYANGGYPPIIFIQDANNSGHLSIQAGRSSVDWTGYVSAVDHSTNFSGNLPADITGNNFDNKWHHIAITYKNDQMKVYVDKYRVLLVPRCNGLVPAYLLVEGIGSQDRPMIFKNFKIADGAQMYMTGQKFTDAKIVTHGINFDIDKATIKPESMGTLNMVVQVMKDNPDVKFEVDGHTDNTSTPAHNQTLSQQRADAVMAQLIVMGVDPARLTSKGFGDSKPMADNTTLEGKANNRRVEFVKQ
jgi:OOP family OmpA-OmpF porin